jgi:hypothetical protein
MAENGVLDLVTTDELLQELGKRHNGASRALCVVSCVPEDGKPGYTSFRTMFMSQDKALLMSAIVRAMEALRANG